MSTRVIRNKQTLNANAAPAETPPPAQTQAKDATTLGSNIITRRFNVNINGSLMSLNSEGPSASSWHPSEKTLASAWSDPNIHGTQDHQAILKSLSNVHIVKCTCIESQNTFPVPLSVHINCIPGSEISENGEKVAFTSLANAHNTQPITLYENDAHAGPSQEWMKLFGEYTKDNILVKNVLNLDKENGRDYVYVHQDHPVISVLRANPEILGAPLDDHQKIDNEWFKVSLNAHQTCCDTICKRILSQVSSSSVRGLNVSIARNDLASEWCEITGPLAHAHSLDAEVVNKPCFFHTRLELQYTML